MAPGLALACRAAGADVRIVGRNAQTVAAAAEAAGVEAAPLESASLADVDLAVENVVEELEAKLDLLPRVESWLRADALLATNTSGLPIGQLAAPLAGPERFAGFHFLN